MRTIFRKLKEFGRGFWLRLCYGAGRDGRRSRKRAILWRAALFFVFLLLLFVIRQLSLRTYTDYAVLSEKEQADSVSRYQYADGMIFCYSPEGASLIRSDWEVLWNETFSMTQPTVDVRGKSIALYDKGDTSVRIYDRSGRKGSFEAAGPLLFARVAESGSVACAVKSGDTAKILYYTSDGSLIAELSAAFSDPGVPVSMALSPDGTLLAVSCITAAEGKAGTNLVFYRFDEAGQQETDHVVFREEYPGTLIPEIRCAGDKAMIAFREDGASVYSTGTVPKKTAEIDLEEEILSIFSDDSHIGFVFRGDESEDRYRMTLYKLSGKKASEAEVNILYDTVRIDGNRILFFGGTELAVYTLGGKCVYSGTLREGELTDVIRMGSNRYFVYTDMRAETIKLI